MSSYVIVPRLGGYAFGLLDTATTKPAKPVTVCGDIAVDVDGSPIALRALISAYKRYRQIVRVVTD